MKQKIKSLLNDLTLRLFGAEIIKCRRKWPLRPYRKVNTIFPEGWPLTPTEIGTNIHNQLRKK
jgi:hypothetical protein